MQRFHGLNDFTMKIKHALGQASFDRLAQVDSRNVSVVVPSTVGVCERTSTVHHGTVLSHVAAAKMRCSDAKVLRACGHRSYKVQVYRHDYPRVAAGASASPKRKPVTQPLIS